MAVAIITGSAGLVGSEASYFFAGQGFDIVGIDNETRRRFFGEEASIWQRRNLGARLHGFLAYLMKCTDTDEPYTICGYKGKFYPEWRIEYDLPEVIHEIYESNRTRWVCGATA